MIVDDYEIQFLKWVYPLSKEHFKGKKVLDAGCGIGRNSYWPIQYGAKEVVAFDYDERTVAVARKNLEKFSNVNVSYQSIYDINFENYFDIAFSIGVIHHLKDPVLAVKNLARAVEQGGIVLIWVYGYEGNEWIVRYVNPVRRFTSKLPIKLVDFLALFCSVPLYIYLKLIPHKHPYFKQLATFKFWHVHSIVLDQLIPEVANYWTQDEAGSLLQKAGLENVKTFQVNQNSWTVIGQKTKQLNRDTQHTTSAVNAMPKSASHYTN